jgi:NADPH:quinone reductase-like Zn-dependent oxidoreductase
VQDNGRGIPTAMHTKEKKSALEVVMTVLHAGGKFDKDTYKVSGGLHGVGVSCVNALSTHLSAVVHRDGKIFQQEYNIGRPLYDVKEIGTSDRTGTEITFRADGSIFESTVYNYETLAARMRELAFLNKGIRITLTDKREMDEEGKYVSNLFFSEGGLAEFAVVKANQLMPKPEHLTWEEAASPGLVNSTAYRQLVSRNGAGMKQGDIVLIWGASGGLGSYATQYALNGGAIPVCVVSSPEKAQICRDMGAELVIDRSVENYKFWKDPQTQDPKEWQRFGKKIRELTGGEDPDIVFEHPGRETFGASVYVTKRGGTIVTCASTTGYMHEYDNRYLWMNLKRIIGTHFANYREAYEANRLIAKGMIHPTLSKTFALEETGQAAFEVYRNEHQGKVGVLCLAPEPGLGVINSNLREHNIDGINRFVG